MIIKSYAAAPLLAAIGSLMLLISSPHAQQTARVVASCGSATYTAGSTNYVTIDTAGNQCGATGGGGSAASNLTQIGGTSINNGGIAGAQGVGGTSAAGAADDNSNPVKVGGVFLGTLPTLTTGQRSNMQVGPNGLSGVLITSYDGTAGSDNTGTITGLLARVSTNYNGAAAPLAIASYGFNGTGWNRFRDIVGAVAAGTGVTAVAEAPNSAASAAIVPVVSTALETCHQLKASPGNLYWLTVTIQATTGVVQVFNSTTAPSAGAVTPIWSQPIISNGTVGGGTWNFTGGPIRGSTGLYACFSSATTPFTYTASATAMISAGVQ